MNRQHKKDGDFHAGAVGIFLLQKGALWDEWTLVIHCSRAQLRRSVSIEAICLMLLRSLRGFPSKKPGANFQIFRCTRSLRIVCGALAHYLGAAAGRTPTN